MFAGRPPLAEKVLTVSCRPDLNSKQLVTFIRGELFLVCVQRRTHNWGSNTVGSNSKLFSGHDMGHFLYLAVR